MQPISSPMRAISGTMPEVDSVKAGFANPPRSTEQILHPNECVGLFAGVVDRHRSARRQLETRWRELIECAALRPRQRGPFAQDSSDCGTVVIAIRLMGRTIMHQQRCMKPKIRAPASCATKTHVFAIGTSRLVL